jgi:AraC family transcriptional regulator
VTRDTRVWTNYEDRMGWVIDYIYGHLDEPIDLNTMANVACLSAFHWHRIFHALYGETIASTVKRLRMHQAAGYLVHTNWPVREVAKKSGYRNLQSFTRLFAKSYGLPPGEYRKRGNHQQFKMNTITNPNSPFSIDIQDLRLIRLVGLRHSGSYLQIDRTFQRLFRLLGARGLLDRELRMFGVYYDDSSMVKASELRSVAGLQVFGDINVDPPLEIVEVGGGLHAVLKYQGPYVAMHAAYCWLYGTWIPQSRQEVASKPVFEEYLNDPRQNPPRDLKTKICLPLKGSSDEC